MEIFKSDYICITQKYTGISAQAEMSHEEISHLMIEDYGTSVHIQGEKYDAVPLYKVVRANQNTLDGKYHFIYFQINVDTAEYYIGKVNREKWKDVNRYQGSGLVFKKKYDKYSNQFVRYYIAACKSAKETEILEAKIVNDKLLEDPFCLNLVRGGGGTNNHNDSEERKRKIREYMLSHPENYKKMLEKARELASDEVALQARNRKIKETMSDEVYKKMTSDRIKKWKVENPEAYSIARENNRTAVRSNKTAEKRKKSLEKWREDNPEKYESNKSKALAAAHSQEAEEKRSKSLKAWCKDHPDVIKARVEKSVEKCRKPVNMLDLNTGEVLEKFSSIQEAAQWLVDNGKAINCNCKSSICAVCMKKPCTTGYGYRKKAYGYGWEYSMVKES